MSEKCIFCDIDDAALIYRNADGIVLLADPVRPGHVLVGSVVHGADLHDLSEDQAAGVLRLANRVAKQVLALTTATKVYVAAIGDKDRHFHVHLLPKDEGDPGLGPHIFGSGGWKSSLPAASDPDVLGGVNERLRSSLSRSTGD